MRVWEFLNSLQPEEMFNSVAFLASVPSSIMIRIDVFYLNGNTELIWVTYY